MARTPKTTTEAAAEPALNETALAVVGAAPAQLAAIQAGYSEDRDLANQMLGQIQMSRAISKFTDVVSLQKLKYIKENKSYRALSGQKGIDRHGSEITDVGTWAGFCAALGVSASKVDEDLTNLQIFGEDALAQLTQAGAGYRELRQYRKLPEDQKQALIEVAKAGDKESFVELAEEIIAKHAKEKETMAAELQDVRDQVEDLAASKKMVETSLAEARKQARQFAQATPDEQAQDLRGKVQDLTLGLEAALMGELRDGLEQLAAHGEDAGLDQRAWIKGQLGLMLDRLQIVAGRLGVELAVQSDTPAWLDTSAIPGAHTNSEAAH